MIRGLVLAAAVVGVLAVGAARAQDTPDVPTGDATLRGRLVPHGGAQVADTLVILYSLSPHGEPGLRSTHSDARGEFAFEKIAADPAIVYLVGTRVGSVPYGVRAVFAPGSHEQRVEIDISEPTQDVSRLSRGEVRLRLERGCTHLRVEQSQSLENRSERVLYIPPERRNEQPPLLRADLPADAVGFEAIASAGVEGLEQADGVVRFWGPLHPGRHEIEWAFGLPSRSELPLRIPFPDGAASVSLLLPAGASARGEGLVAKGTRDLPSGRQALYEMHRIPAGGALEAELAIPEAPGGSRPRVEEARMWLELDDAALDVSEQLTLHVDGDQALVSEGGPLLCVPLPEDARDLRFSSGSLGFGLTRDPSGALAMHGPIPPGETPLALRYQLPAGGKTTRFVQSFASEVPLLQVFVADTGLRADSPRMHRKRPVITEDRTYLELEAFSIEPGEEVAITLAPLPARGAPARALAIGVVVLGALGAGAFLLAPLRAGPSETEPVQETVASAERESLYRAIDALDEDLETGKLTPEDHASMRASLRARAVASLASERNRAREASSPEPAPAPAPAACAGCGAALRPGDRFCSQCGAQRDMRGNTAG
jgi:hypothetical protein